MLNTMRFGLTASAGHNSAERRQFPRYPFTATLEAFEPASQTTIHGRTADLSRGGCYVDTISAFPAQTCIKVRITKDQRSFEGAATVVYSVTGMGMGLRFEELDPKELMTLKRWLGQSSGEAVGEMEAEAKKSSPRATGLGSVLSELISELVRKGVLDKDQGESMLQRVTAA